MAERKTIHFEREDVPLAAHFADVDGVLHCDGVPLPRIAERFGTPTYVYAGRAIDEAYDAVDRSIAAVGAREVLIAYAIKANGNLAILKRLAERGCGADIVSGGELARALRAGIPAERIVFSGVGKRDEEIVAALDAGIRAVHVESEPEIDAIAQLASQRDEVATIALRVNPNVNAVTHPYIATGLHDTKFGLELDVAERLLPAIRQSPHLRLEGVACHIGSQLETAAPLQEAVAILVRFAQKCRDAGAPLRSVDVGGGWPMSYGCEAGAFPSPEAFCEAIRAGFSDAGAAPADYDLITEPGRALVGAAGVLLTRVVFVKHQGGRRFVIVDGAMTELIRPALYEAYHAVRPVRAMTPSGRADVVGPVCESGDFFALERPMGDVKRGDLVALLGAGAYGRDMAMTYNGRPAAAEVLCEGGELREIRRRAPLESLWAGEGL
ncbi:MAG: diaminopimelate decarboxylase [Myxococcota bacterium]